MTTTQTINVKASFIENEESMKMRRARIYSADGRDQDTGEHIQCKSYPHRVFALIVLAKSRFAMR